MSYFAKVVSDPGTASGLVTANHMGKIWQTNPQYASNVTTKLLAYMYGSSVHSILNDLPTKYVDSDADFLWRIDANHYRNYALVEARKTGGAIVSDGDTGIGAGRARFDLVFNQRCFSDQMRIVGEKNEVYPIRIVDEPSMEGGNWVYSCELMNSNVSAGMPGKELIRGKRFSVDFTPVERSMSQKGSDMTLESGHVMRNTFSTLRKQYTVPGNMANQLVGKRVAFSFTGMDRDTGESKEFGSWMTYVEWQFHREFEREKSNVLHFGTSNQDEYGKYSNFGSSGFEIITGSGIREQMEVSNTIYYNHFDIKLFTSILLDLTAGKLSFGDRNFVALCGEHGLAQFSQAASNDGTGWKSLASAMGNVGASSVQKTTSPYHSNSLKLGYQVTEFLAPNGITVKFKVDEAYDDPIRNKILHPSGGVAMSYRYDILDISLDDGEPNIQKVMVKNYPDITKYVAGIRNPFDGSGDTSGFASNSTDASQYHLMSPAIGVMVRDPSRTVSLIPSVVR